MSAIANLLDWFKDNIKHISTRALETIARIVYTIPLAEDWQYVNSKQNGAVHQWLVPEGQYEVYVAPSITGAYLDLTHPPSTGGYLVPLGFQNCFYPQLLAISLLSMTGEIGTAGMGDTNLALAGDVISSMAPQGWTLSTDDLITSDNPFIVRYRRIA